MIDLPGAAIVPGMHYVVALSVAVPSPAPDAGSWVMLLPAGQFQARDGRGPFRTGDLAAMQAVVAASLARAGDTEIVVDYDHQSVFASVPGVGGRAPAAGWIKSLEARPDGIWGLIQWTEAAAQAIRAGEYRYLSPYFSHDKTGRVGLIASAGLVNTPALDLGGAIAARTIGDHDMDIAALRLSLGLDDTADEAAVLARLNQLNISATALSTIAAAVGLQPGAEAAMVTAAVTSLSGQRPDPAAFVPMSAFQALQADFAALSRATADRAAAEAVENAMAAGKVAPALKDWAMEYARSNLTGFQAFVSSAPAIVSPQAPGGQPKTGEPKLEESDLAVMRALGHTEEQMMAAKKAAC